MSAKTFIRELSDISLDGVFNPYRDRCRIHDRNDAPAVRRKNLEIKLDAALHHGVSSLWIGRDLGYRGGRRTGIALTDDVHLVNLQIMWGAKMERATQGEPMRERTAAMIWLMLSKLHEPIFLWNLFPFHPHEMHDEMSNRAHTRIERAVGEKILRALLALIRPDRVLAIGRDAANALDKMNIDCVAVRHPSYGGQSAFAAGIRNVYCLDADPCPERLI